MNMELISKSDLVYNDYAWEQYNERSPYVKGDLDTTPLNRTDGNQILYFINKIAATYGFQQKTSAHKIEEMLRTKVPSELTTRERVKNWITSNWFKF